VLEDWSRRLIADFEAVRLFDLPVKSRFDAAGRALNGRVRVSPGFQPHRTVQPGSPARDDLCPGRCLARVREIATFEPIGYDVTHVHHV
jgi:hypothetical protein